MADIPGIESIRLLIQQPVAMLKNGPKIHYAKSYILEIGFPDGTAMNLPIGKNTYDELLSRMASQPGVSIARHVAAQGHVGGETPVPLAREVPIPNDATEQEMLEALAEAIEPPPEIHPRKLKP